MEHHPQPDSPQKAAGQQDNKLHLTAISSLLVWAAVAAFCAWLMVSTFYSNLADFTVWVSIPVMLLAMAIYIRRAIGRNRLGQDRHQLHPVRAARAFVVGRSSAFAGAIFFGVGVGSGIYVWPRVHILAAAQADSPGVIVFTVVGFLLAAAGLVLERSCQVPPDKIEKDTAGAHA